MMSFDNCAKIVGALDLPLETRVHRLLTDRVEQCRSTGLLDRTHILIIEPGDTEEGIAQEIGFSPLVNPMDYGDPGFRMHRLCRPGLRLRPADRGRGRHHFQASSNVP